jgi:protein-S-isoprenylcysteine O-methyltransferase Ste14
MSLIPAFEIGLWNAWIFWAAMILSMIIPDFIKSKEAKERSKRASQWAPFKKKKDKILALSTHMVIMPVSIIYSIFLPIKIGTAWFYTGLVILIAALVISLMSTISFAITPVDKPFTGGIYSISRHPVYLSGFLLYLSIAIASASWIILLCAVLWLVFLHIVIPAEESHLIDQYGEAYREYRNSTPKWIGIPKSTRK